MSNTIDQRVVEMRFDNKQFESGVSTTMSTLEKLKEKLNLTGASKGLDNLNAAAKKFDMSGLTSAADTVSAKFSAMQVAGITAIANITNSAVNYGKRIVKSLTVDPIQTGFNEYELKMGSIQTIMAGTGEKLDRVNQKLNELNEYSDQTIYSFKDMTDNIGKFTNAGVNLDDAVAAIKGISNAAALAGATSGEASRAMYNFSQSLSSGYVQLTDWRSIELANMATSEFREQLIEAAVATGTLKKKADGLWETLEGSEVTVENFRTTLQDKWLTSDALVKALNQYADGTTDVGRRATAAATEVKTFSMMMDTLKESAQSGWAQTWELLVGDFEEAKALFTEMSEIFGNILGNSSKRRNNLIGDALNSNWDKFVNKLGEAGVDITDFEDTLKEIVGDTKFDKLVEEFGSVEEAAKKGKITVDELKKALDKTESGGTGNKYDFSGMAEKVKGNRFTYSIGGLGRASEEVKQIQTALNELGYDLTPDGKFGKATYQAVMAFQKAQGIKIDGIVGEETIAALEKATEKSGELAGNLDDVNDASDDLFKNLNKKSGRELIFDSLLNIIKAIQRPLEAVGEAFRSVFSINGDQIYGVLEKIEKFTDSFVPKGILDIDNWDELRKAVGKLGIDWADFQVKLKETLGEEEVKRLNETYGNIAKAFNEGAISADVLLETLTGFDGITESLVKGGKACDKIMRAFKGLFSILKIFTTFAGGAFSIGFRILQTVLDKFDIGLLDFAANVGDAMTKVSDYINKLIDSGIGAVIDWLIPKVESAIKAFNNWSESIKQSEKVQNIVKKFENWPAVIEKVSGAFSNGIKYVSDWIDKFKETDFFQTVSGWISSAAETIETSLSGVSTAVDNFNLSTIGQKLQEFGTWVSDVASAISKTKTFTTIMGAITSAFTKLDNVVSGFSFDFSKLSLGSLLTFAKNGKKLEGKNAFSGIKNFFTGFASMNLDTFKWNWQQLCNKALTKFTDFWLKWGDRVKAAFEMCKNVALSIKEFIFGTEQVDLPTILGVAEKFLGIIVLYTALKTLQGFTAPFEGVANGLNNLAKAVKWAAIGDAFKSMAVALGVLTVCILVLASIEDMNKATAAAKMLVGLLIAMGLIIAALSFVTKFTGGLDAFASAGSLLAVIVALALLVKLIEQLDASRLKDPLGTFIELFAMLGVLMLGVKMVAKAGQSSFGSIVAILTMITALKQILDVIKSYDEFNWAGMTDAVMRMIGMLMMLSLALNVATRGVKNPGGFTGLAMTLLVMVLSLKMLAKSIVTFAEIPNNQLLKGGAVVAVILAMMTWMIVEIGNAGNFKVLEKGQKAVSSFSGLALALLTVVAAIWILAKTPTNVLVKGGIAVTLILGIFTLMLTAIGKTCSGLKMGTLIVTLVGIALIIAEIAVIIHLMQDVPWQGALGHAVSMALILGGLVTALRILTKNTINPTSTAKWIVAIAMLGTVVYGLAMILKSMQGIDPLAAIGHVTALSILLTVMAGVFEILTKHQNRPQTIMKWVGGMAGMGLILYGLTGVLNELKTIDPVNAIGNATALSILMLAMAKVLEILTKHQNKPETIKKWIGAMAGLGLVCMGLAVVMRMLSVLDPVALLPNVIALSALLYALTGVMVILSKTKPNVDPSIVKSMAILGLVVAELAVFLHLLNGVETEGLMIKVAALSTLLLVLSPCMIALSTAGKIAKAGGLSSAVGALAVVALALVVVVDALSRITGAETARTNAITLGGLAVVLSACVLALSVAGLIAMSGSVVPGVAALGTIATALGLLVLALSAISGVETARANAITLSALAIALTACVTVLSVVGLLIPGVVAGVSALVIVATTLGLLVWALSGIQNVDTARTNAITLAMLLNIISGVLVALAPMGAGAALAAGAIAVLVNVVTSLGALVTVIGWLSEHCDGLEKFIDNGLNIFIKLAGGIGEMISAFAIGVTSGLPEVGRNLSAFMAGVLPFVTLVKSVDESVATGTGNLTKAILSLLIADFISGVADIFNLSLVDLATELCDFAKGITPFLDAMKTVDGSAATGVESLCSAINALTEANLKDAIVQLFPGDNSLSSFGTNISAFAGCIKEAADSLKNITDADVENITRAATAGEAMAKLNDAIPGSGGKWQEWAGEKNLADWGKTISAFGDSLVAYSAKVSGKTFDTQAITNSATAAQAIADLNTSIPASGGHWQEWSGDKNLADWGKTIVAFGGYLSEYSNAVSGTDFNPDAISNSAKAAAALAEVAAAIPSEGGLMEWFSGEKNLSSFGTGLSSLATGITDYATEAAKIDESAVTNIENSGAAIDALKAVVEKLPSEGGVGGLLWGEKDPTAFGNSIGKLANGITTFCTEAAKIDDSTTTTIENAGKAIDAIATVVNDMPDIDEPTNSANLSASVSSLKVACDSLNTISAAEYDFSCIDTLKTVIAKLAGMFTDVSVTDMYADFQSLNIAVTNAVECASKIASLNNYTFTGVDTLKGALSSLAEANVDGVISAFSGKAESLGAAVNSVVSALTIGISNGGASVNNAVSGLMTSAVASIKGSSDSFTSAGRTLGDALSKGLKKMNDSMERAGKAIAGEAKSGARSLYSDMKGAGEYLGKGFVAGVKTQYDEAYDVGYGLGQEGERGLEDALKIQSPSKVAMKDGKYVGEGLVIGIGSMFKAVYKSGYQMGEKGLAGISNSIARISDAINSDIDAQPTIRPVLDLSDVRAGASSISSLLDANPAIMANVGSISTMMNRRSQNGANDEVVSAITKLRRDLANMPRESYNINGVTYDDGSNIKSFAEAVVHQARLERRV